VKAGVFVFVSMVLVFGTLFLVAGLRLTKNVKTYCVRFRSESVTGLEASSTVRYSGVPVGRVSNIGFAADAFPDIEVTIEVKPGTPIRENTTAQLKPQGITGIYYIDLGGGSPVETLPDGTTREIPLLAEGGMIEADASVTVQIMETLSGIGSVVKNLNSILEENRDEIGDVVSELVGAAREARTALTKLDRALEGAGELTREVRVQFTGAIESAQSSLSAMERFMNDPDIQEIPGKVGDFLDRASSLAETAEEAVSAAKLEDAIQRMEETFERLRSIEDEVHEAVLQLKLGVAENRGAVMRTTAHLREFARNMKMFSKEIRAQPSRLFFGQPPSDRKEDGR